MAKQEWTITTTINGNRVSWSYDDIKDAKRAWSHIRRKRETIDTHDKIHSAHIRLPRGSIYYLEESVDWREGGI